MFTQLRQMPLPARVPAFYRVGLAAGWLWLGAMLGLGFDNWTPGRPVPVLFDPNGLRLPYAQFAWLPVWSPVPGGGMGWLCVVLIIAAPSLALNRWPRAAATVLLCAYGWLVGVDSILNNAHRYLLVCMTAAFLLLRAGPQEVPPSVYDGLPIRILAVCLWGWAAFAKATPAWWSGHALYADLLYLSPPALGALWAHMPDAWFVLFARTTLVIEAAIAVGLLFGPTARLASGAAVAMCVAFLPLVPIFGVATAVLTLAAARCTAVPVPGTARSQPHPPQLHPLQSHPLQPVRIWHMLALGGFLAWQVLLPVRTYLFDDHYATGRGWPWTWRQMTMVRHGQLRVEVLDPAYGWQDATPALTPIVDDFQAFPCSIPWGIAWVRRSRPDLLPPDRRVRVLRLGAGPAVPPACDTRTP